VSGDNGLPDLDAFAGRHLRFCGLAEAEETWLRLRPNNLSHDPGTDAVMTRLPHDRLDPVIDGSGSIQECQGPRAQG
jgi:hypothetical protein